MPGWIGAACLHLENWDEPHGDSLPPALKNETPESRKSHGAEIIFREKTTREVIIFGAFHNISHRLRQLQMFCSRCFK